MEIHQNIKIRSSQKCQSCEKEFHSGTLMKKYSDKRPGADFTEHKHIYICGDCEKFYKRVDPKVF